MRCTIPEISWHNREPVLSVDIHPVSSDFYRLASGGGDSHILIWHMTVCENGAVKQEVVADLTRHQKAVNTVRWSPSGQYLASADDDANIIVWQLKTDNVPLLEGSSEDKEIWIVHKVLRGHKEDIYDMCWSVDNMKLFSGSVDNTAILWDLQKGKMDQILDDHKGFVQGVAWDPKGQFLATISTDRICRVFDISGKHVKARIHKGKLPVPDEHFLFEKESKYFHDDTFKSFFRRLDFSPDGSLLVVPSGHIQAEDCKKILNATLVFTMDNFNEPAAVLPLPQQCSTTVRFCPVLFALRPDGPDPPLVRLPYRMVFAVGADNDVVLYDTQQARPFARLLQIHYTRLTDLAWARDGRVLVGSSTDGFCTLITFEEGELGAVYEPTEGEKSPEESTPTPCAPEDENVDINSKEADEKKRSSFLKQWALASQQQKKNRTASAAGSEIVVIEEDEAPKEINRLIPRRIAPIRVGECGASLKAAPIEVSRAPREGGAKPIAVRRQPRILDAKATPVEAKATPFEAKATPVEAKATPFEAKATPVEAKEAPVEVKATPVETKEASVEVKATPDGESAIYKKLVVILHREERKCNVGSVEAKAIPVDSKAVSIDSKAVPVDSKAVSIDSKAVPVDSKAVPVDSKTVPVDSKAIPVDSKAVSNDSKAVPNDSKAIPVDSKAIPVDSKAIPVDSKAVSNDSKAVSNDSKAVSNDSKAVPVDSKAVPVDSKTVPVDSKAVSNDSKAVSNDSKAVSNDSKAVSNDSKVVSDDDSDVVFVGPVVSKAPPVGAKVPSKPSPVAARAPPADTEKSKTCSRKRKGCSSTPPPPPTKRVSAARRKLNASTPPKSNPLLDFLKKRGGRTSRPDVLPDEEEARDCWTSSRSCPTSRSDEPGVGDDDDRTEDFCLQLEATTDEVIEVSDDSCQSAVVEKKAPRRVALITLASPKSARGASKRGDQ